MGVHKDMTLEEAEQLFGFISGTPYDATVVKNTYRNLTKTYHPDAVRNRGGDVDTATAQMGRINTAKSILENATREGRTVTAGNIGGTANTTDAGVSDDEFWAWVNNMSNQYDQRMKEEAKAKARAAAEREAENKQRKGFWSEMRGTPFKVINAAGVPVNSIWDVAEEQQARKIVAERQGKCAEYATAGSAASAGSTKKTGNTKSKKKSPAWYRFVKWVIDHIPYRLIFFFLALTALAATGDADSWEFQYMPLVYLIFIAALINLIFPFVTKPLQELLQAIWCGVGSIFGIA